MFFHLVGMFTIVPQTVVYLIDAGFEPVVAATAFGVTGMLSVATLAGIGFVAARFGYRRTVTASFVGTGIGMLALAALSFHAAGWLLVLFVLVFGACQGVRGPIISAICSAKFAGPRVATIYGMYAMNLARRRGRVALGGVLHDLTRRLRRRFGSRSARSRSRRRRSGSCGSCATSGRCPRAQPGEILIDHPPGLAREREVLRLEQPVADQPVDQGMQPHRGAARVHARRQEAAPDRVADAALELAEALGAHLDVAVAHARHLVHVLAFVADDLEHAPRLRVVGGLAEHDDHAAADVTQRIGEASSPERPTISSIGRSAREHGGEEVGLVAEVPVIAPRVTPAAAAMSRATAATPRRLNTFRPRIECGRALPALPLWCVLPSVPTISFGVWLAPDTVPARVAFVELNARTLHARTLHTFTHVCKLLPQENHGGAPHRPSPGVSR
jgi:hypothetical protein